MDYSKTLEINLISAQGLKSPSANIRRLQTYAVVWIDSSVKLRTQVDKIGGENPTWNDKFLFKVTPVFLSSATSGVSFEIFAVGYLRDPLLGRGRMLVSNVELSDDIKTPSFIALPIRRPSGRCHGIINIGAALVDGSGFSALNEAPAIGYRDLMGEIPKKRSRDSKLKKSVSFAEHFRSENGDSEELSDDTESTTSSSSTASSVLRDWNCVRDLAGTNHGRSSSDGGALFCGLLMQRRIPQCFSELNLHEYRDPEKEN